MGLGIGFGAGWLSYRGRQSVLRRDLEEERINQERGFNALQIELAKTSERNRIVEDQRQTLHSELAQERQFNISLHAELSRERASRNHLEQKIEQQKADFSKFQETLGNEFRSVVQQVLEEKSRTLSDLNKSNLNVLLQPISEKLQDFKQKIEEQHYRETKELIVLHNKLSNLEAGRSRPGNGTPAIPTAPSIIRSTSQAVPSQDQAVAFPEAEVEMTEPANELPASNGLHEDAVQNDEAEKSDDSDAFQSFSPKQEVEIDNFLKRTLGRAQRKKPDA